MLAVGARDRSIRPDWGGYTVDEAALRHNTGVERETTDQFEAYAPVPRREPTRATATAGFPSKLLVARHLVVLLAVFVATGCAGGSQAPTSFSAADAERIASVRPTTPDWAWPESPVSSGSCISADEPGEVAANPLQAALDRQFADAGFICDAGGKWQDDEKLGSLAAMRFETATGAHEGLAAFRVFAHGWGEKSGEVIGDEELDDLSDEATRLRVGANGVQVTYLWRRGNLVLQVHVHCFDFCPTDVDALTRVWVDAIDEEARTGG